jgi:hypothetical protein
LSALLELPHRTTGHAREPTKMSDVYSLGLLTVEVCISSVTLLLWLTRLAADFCCPTAQ